MIWGLTGKTGLVTTTLLGGELTATRTHNAQGLLTNQKIVKGSTVLHNMDYVFDGKTGNLTSRTGMLSAIARSTKTAFNKTCQRVFFWYIMIGMISLRPVFNFTLHRIEHCLRDNCFMAVFYEIAGQFAMIFAFLLAEMVGNIDFLQQHISCIFFVSQ